MEVLWYDFKVGDKYRNVLSFLLKFSVDAIWPIDIDIYLLGYVYILYTSIL